MNGFRHEPVKKKRAVNSPLKMEAVCFFETLVSGYKTIRCRNSEDLSLNSPRHENAPKFNTTSQYGSSGSHGMLKIDLSNFLMMTSQSMSQCDGAVQ
jgi:hypothetical protein